MIMLLVSHYNISVNTDTSKTITSMMDSSVIITSIIKLSLVESVEVGEDGGGLDLRYSKRVAMLRLTPNL